MHRQIQWAAAEPPHIVVGNPKALQRLVDMGRLRLQAVDMVVLDEVDACIIEKETKKVLCCIPYAFVGVMNTSWEY